MIGRLQGVVVEKDHRSVIIDVAGVGYTVLVPQITNNNCQLQQPKTLSIYTAVKEDAITLYGFDQSQDKQLFELLITVTGVGPKLGLAILSAHSAPEVIRAISDQQLDFFTSISGIGKKNAQRLILELRNKVSQNSDDIDLYQASPGADLQQALTTLGYNPKEIATMTKNVDHSLSVEEQIKQSLGHSKA